jgi:hypothetical protein
MAENDASQVLQNLVAQSRAEQAAISSKILALRSDLDPISIDGVQGSGTQVRNGGGQQQVSQLREEVADLESSLMERDAEIDGLRFKVADLEDKMRSAVNSGNYSSVWQTKYEEQQRIVQMREQRAGELQNDQETRQQELTTLMSYITMMRKNGSQDERERTQKLDMFSNIRDSHHTAAQDRQYAEESVMHIQGGIVRCIHRVTQSIAAGIMTVTIGTDDEDIVTFATLRSSDEGGVLELFEEPDANWEMASVDLSTSSGASASVDRLRYEINLRAGSGGEPMLIKCANPEEFAKWAGALHLVGLLPKEHIHVAKKDEPRR